MATLDDNPALVIGLQAAVQLNMLELSRLDPANRDATRTGWAADAIDPVASRGDALQYGGKRGEAAKVFNHLARGLAALAYQPGGVTYAGQHWCADHAACLDAARQAAEGPSLLDRNPDGAAPAAPTYQGRPLTTITTTEVL